MLDVLRGKRPDITPAQLVGLVPIVATLLSAFFGIDLTQEQQDALEKALLAVPVLFLGDAAIRIGRNVADAKRDAAALSSSSEPPVGGGGPHAATPAEVLEDDVALTPEELEAGDLPDDDEEFASPPRV